MNAISIHSKNMVDASSNDYLLTLRPVIAEQREILCNYLKTFPAPLDQLLFSHYTERLRKAESRIMHGEYAAYMIGDLFSISPAIIQKLSFPWLLLYEYGLSFDDLVDNHSLDFPYNALLPQYVLKSAKDEYKKIIGESKLLWLAFDSYHAECINAMRNEIEYSTNNNNSHLFNIIQQGKKAAIVKFCAASMVYLQESRLLTTKEEKCIEHICAGIQLLDDICDSIEDHSAQRQNILLSNTYRWIHAKINYSQNLDLNQLQYGLVFSGSISNSWYLAAIQLTKALGLVKDKTTPTYKYFDTLAKECKQSSKSIKQLIHSVADYKKYFPPAQKYSENDNIFHIDRHNYLEFIKYANIYINDGPKACN